MRILYLSPRFPYPPTRGDRLTGYQFIRTMSERHRVTLLSFMDGSEPAGAVQAIEPWCERVLTVRLPHWRSWLQAWIGLPSRRPSQVSYYDSAEMRKVAAEQIRNGGFDVVFVQLIRMAPYAAPHQHPLKVLFMADSLATSLQRSRQFVPAWKRPGVDWEAARMERYEAAITASFRESWMLSEGETLQMHRRGAVRMATVRHGVDQALFAIERPAASDPVAVFLGNLSVPHNMDAAAFAAREIWPRVRSRLPGASLRLVGADARPLVLALASCPGVEVTGFVPDLAGMWRQAGVMIAPLRYSTGIQNKVLEAMAAGVPVVAAPPVAEAIAAKGGVHLMVAESAEDYAAAVLATFSDPDAARARAAAARAHVRENFRWSEAVERLEALAGAAAPPMPEARRAR